MTQNQGLLIDKERPLICSDCARNIGLRACLPVRQNVGHEHALLVQNLANDSTAMAFLRFATTAH